MLLPVLCPLAVVTVRTDLCVWNAKTMDEKPIAVVKLPARVPLGFHALFVSEAELNTQAA